MLSASSSKAAAAAAKKDDWRRQRTANATAAAVALLAGLAPIAKRGGRSAGADAGDQVGPWGPSMPMTLHDAA